MWRGMACTDTTHEAAPWRKLSKNALFSPVCSGEDCSQELKHAERTSRARTHLKEGRPCNH
eukprot:scaffold1467_cov264-Pinguiococcus_pyrenoidosus.AAC.7